MTNGLERDFGNFGDDGDGLDLSSLGSGLSSASSGLGDAASGVTSGLGDSLSSATSGITSGLGDGLSSATAGLGSTLSSTTAGLGSSLSSVTSGATDALSGATQGLSGAASGILSGAQGAVGGALSSVQQAAGGVLSGGLGTVTNAAKGLLANSGITNVLATAEGAMTSADGIANSLQSGDYLSAGAQALKIVQQAAGEVHSADKALAAGGLMAAKMAAAGAAIGSVVPVIGNVVGAIVGAIVGFVAGMIDSLSGNLLSGGDAQAFFQGYQNSYLLLKDSSLVSKSIMAPAIKAGLYDPTKSKNPGWFLLSAKDDAGWKNNTLFGAGNYVGQYRELLTAVVNKKVGNPVISRNAFWQTWPKAYIDSQGSGATATRISFSSGINTDEQPALDLFMQGSSTDPISPTAGIDYALWLAVQPDGLKQLHADPVELQASITPIMPLAVATFIYMAYVQVLAAPNKYSALAIDAVRQAAIKQGNQAGPQVAQVLQLSLPSDDLELLLHAYSFLNVPEAQGQADYPAQSSLYSGQTLQSGSSIWDQTNRYRLTLQPDGNLVVYASKDDSNHLWASNTVGSNAAYLTMQDDGNLVIYTKDKHPVWASNTAGSKGAVMTLQPDSNLVVYSGARSLKAIWTAGIPAKPFSIYPLLSYMVERTGLWGSVDDNTPTVKALKKTIGQVLWTRVKSIDDAKAILNKLNGQDALQLSQPKINDLAASAQSESNNWKKTFPGDPYKGASAAAVSSLTGLTQEKAITQRHHTKPTKGAKASAKAASKSNLTNHHWWIEAVVAALVGIGVYKVVHPKTKTSHPV